MNFQLEKNVSLAQYTTLQVGGVADYVATVRNNDELMISLKLAKQMEIPTLIIGGGSNLLIGDEGFRGLVIRNQILERDYFELGDGEIELHCGAGEVFDLVVADSVGRGYWGLENLSAIPGTVGATPIQNVGAYGVEVSSLIKCVEAINVQTQEVKKFSNQDCDFFYRESFFKTEEGRQWVVTKVVFTLSSLPNPRLDYADLTSLKSNKNISLTDIRQAVTDIRLKKFPDWHSVGTAGSFFKNPIIENDHYQQLSEEFPGLPGYVNSDSKTKVSLGWILDKICGLKGYCNNGVCLYEYQALVLVNKTATSARLIDEFAKEIEKKVFAKTKIKIEREVRTI